MKKKSVEKKEIVLLAEFSIRSDGIIENFLLRQGTESARCTIFRSVAVVFFGRIPLVGRSVEGSVR